MCGQPSPHLLLLSSSAYGVECEQTVCFTHFGVCCYAAGEESGSHSDIRLTPCTLYHRQSWSSGLCDPQLVQEWWARVVLKNVQFFYNPAHLSHLPSTPWHYQNNHSNNNNNNKCTLSFSGNPQNKPKYYFSVFIRLRFCFEGHYLSVLFSRPMYPSACCLPL